MRSAVRNPLRNGFLFDPERTSMSKVQLGHYTGGEEEPTTGSEMAGPPTHRRAWDHHEKEWGPWYPLSGPRSKRGKPLVFPRPAKPHYPAVHTTYPSHSFTPSITLPMGGKAALWIKRWLEDHDPPYSPSTEDPAPALPATATSTNGTRRSISTHRPPTLPYDDEGGWLAPGSMTMEWSRGAAPSWRWSP